MMTAAGYVMIGFVIVVMIVLQKLLNRDPDDKDKKQKK